MENNFKPWWWEEEKELIIDQEIDKFQNGGLIEETPISEEVSIIPTGSMHREKNNLPEELGLTAKGIPVIQNVDDSSETLQDIIDNKDNIVLSSEIEALEITFSKELTNFIEENRKVWEETHDPEIALEVGKRVTKEILFNTTDKSNLIGQLEEKV